MNLSPFHLVWTTIATLAFSHIGAKYLQDNTPRGYWFWFTILNIILGFMFMQSSCTFMTKSTKSPSLVDSIWILFPSHFRKLQNSDTLQFFSKISPTESKISPKKEANNRSLEKLRKEKPTLVAVFFSESEIEDRLLFTYLEKYY